jgi:hypothetical protein
MLTPGPLVTRRRALLLLAVSFGAACTRVEERAVPPPTPAFTPELNGWRAEVQAMLTDGLQTLRTFDVFAAFRVSVTPDSGRRSANELVWDPPSGMEWDAAGHVAHSLRGRADQLMQAISNTQVDASIWREQRLLADVVHDVGRFGDALAAYRDRLDGLRPGDASGALPLLDDAWAQWEQVAVRAGLTRAEAISCGAV